MFAIDNPAPVQEKDVGVGTLIWYKGFTSQGPWDCPAVIYRVGPVNRIPTFYLMSLDDMRKQTQAYQVHEGEGDFPSSLENMRLASMDEVDDYLHEQGAVRAAMDIIEEVQAEATPLPDPCFLPEEVKARIRTFWGAEEPDYSHAAKQAVCWAIDGSYSHDRNAQVDVSIEAGRLAERARDLGANAFIMEFESQVLQQEA